MGNLGPCHTNHVNLPENSGSAQQQEVLDALPVLVFLERGGKVVFANTEARHALGVQEGEWTPRAVEDVLWGLFPGTAEPQTDLINTRAGSPFHATLPTLGGQLLSVEGTYCLLNSDQNEAIIVAHPTERSRVPKSQLMEDVLASIPEAVVIVHGDHVLYANPAFTQMFGYTVEEACGGSLRELIVPETRQHELALLEKEVDERGRTSVETVRMNKSGELIDVALVVGPLHVQGASVGYVLSFRDIGDRKQAESKVLSDLLFDVSTGLPNRALFLDRVAQSLARRSRRNDQNCGILLLDLDHFRELNEVLGHAACDVLLSGVAERLRASLRPEDSPSRMGEDEFGILVADTLDQADLAGVAARVLEAIEEPFDVFGDSIRVSASIGVAIAGGAETTAELLIHDAELALQRARQNGGNCWQFAEMRLQTPLRNRLRDPERELRQVLRKRRYEVWYQPIYRLASGHLEGFESLLRLRHQDGSVNSFRQLLGVAEDIGLSITLGRETMDTVCRQLKSWTEGSAQRKLIVSLNLTERQFYHPELMPQLKKALADNAVDPSLLLFEVAESTLNENQDVAALTLKRMAECGVRIALDNFGARFAPLNHLADLPIDVVKTAPKLTAAAAPGGRPAAVLESLIHLGRALGMQVVAQGIETPEQLAALCSMGCELGQGHLFSYALEPAKATILAGAGRWSLAAGA
jgi:diguanylate cyclase (GGDEF)-like protein/PAS domain S-box-containing protein